MEKSTPVRNSRTCTADLLSWSTEAPPPSSPSRSRHPSQGISKVLFGGQITDEKAESLYKRRPSSGYKLKEMSGSNVFSAGGEDVAPKFGTVNEVAKQQELSGNQESKIDSKVKRQLSVAKRKELSGSDIFGPPLEVPPRSLTVARSLEPEESKDIGEPAPRTVRTSVKVSNPAGGQSSIFFGGEPVVRPVKKIHNQKFVELTGNDIFKGDTPPAPSEKSLSRSKLREMSGSGIFSDGKVESRVCYGGVRKPPGGDSSIRLF
ncbi:hypothetical protein HAX54_007122 [Datura stramonium]|uniref:DUF4057 domain-containing protein n=1 Tax=Datura stramonium TaxID=4076 RepID=A0ABS8TCH7_DATST|nr:hypothetical protein [Datura stramonium]